MNQADPWPFTRTEFHLPEVDSTNSWARRLIAEGTLSEIPALVWTDRQTQGRGQGANSWWSDAGSLTASVVLDPEAMGLAVGVRPRVALGVAAEVALAVEELVSGCRVGVRWPNDVEVDGRKLGGILVEGVSGPAGHRLVVGFGVNVATRLDDAPVEVRKCAATLADIEVSEGQRRVLLRAILARLEPMLRSLATGDPTLVATWNQLDRLFGQTITVQAGVERYTAVAEGIDASGGLRIRRDGRSEILFAGRILRQ